MKTHIKFTLVALLITGVIVISGCGNDNDNPADVNNNTKPLAPSNPKPEHNEIDVGTTAALSWTCSDPEDDSLSYDVYFGTLETPALVESNRRGTSFTPESMDFSTT